MGFDFFAGKELEEDQENFRDSINSIKDDGKRNWVFAKKPKGRFTDRRSLVAFILLLIFFAGPFISINGQPILMLNVLERKFIIFGMAFWPTDFHLLALGALTLVIFIVLFTAVFGRVFCGWACPQTIFMEHVFRRIEYWIEGDRGAQLRLNKQNWNREKILKKGFKQVVFFSVSFLIANLFLSYIIGYKELFDIITDPPSEHLAGLTAITIFSFVFYLVFSRFREQVCHFACPYGRLQSVMIDEDSLNCSYDYIRGEERANSKTRIKAAKKNNYDIDIKELAKGARFDSYGDCIDCEECVRVCPMGIDIRNGIQMECTQCTACIDACDNVMDKIDKPRGLIRYESLNGIEGGKKFGFTPRVAGYSTILVLLLGIFGTLLFTRPDTETIILRTPGVLQTQLDDGRFSNFYDYKLLNKTFETLPFQIKALYPEGAEVRLVGEKSSVNPQDIVEGRLIVFLPADVMTGNSTQVTFGIFSNGEQLETLESNFIGPDNVKK